MVSYVYDAWGRPISKTGSMAATLGTVQPFRYRGYVYDEETGLYYLRSRYYCVATNRFLNSDIDLGASKSPFSYCANSPTNTRDNNGMDAIWINSSDWVAPLNVPCGHTSLLIEYQGNWYYTFFGKKGKEDSGITFVQVPIDMMCSLEAFNGFVYKTHKGECSEYDSATYIIGDFTASFEHFKSVNEGTAPDGNYSLLTNNCTIMSWNLLRMGTAPDGSSYGAYMDEYVSRYGDTYAMCSIPNVNNEAIKFMFPGNGFTLEDAQYSMFCDLRMRNRLGSDPFLISRYQTLVGIEGK